MEGAAGFLVLQHALGSVAEGDDADAFTAHRGCCRQFVDGCITDTLGSDHTAHPGIEDSRSVDTQQYPETGLIGSMVDVGEGVDTALGVVVHLTKHSINHSRCSGCRGNFSGIEHIEAQGIVGLVAGTVGDGGSHGQSGLFGSLCRHLTLCAEGGHDGGEHRAVEAEIVEQEVGGLVLLEVPEHALAESTHGGAGFATEAHGDIVAGQHHLVDLSEQFGLMFLHPCQLGGGEVAGRVEQVLQTVLLAQVVEGPFAIGNGTRVAPDDGGAQSLLLLVDTHQSVHLIGDTDGLDVVSCGTCLLHNLSDAQFGVGPPHLGVLLGPTGLEGDDRCFRLWEEGSCLTLACFDIHQRGLHGAAAHIETQQEFFFHNNFFSFD